MRMDAVTAKKTTAGWTSRPIKSRGTQLILSTTAAAARELPERAMRWDGKIKQHHVVQQLQQLPQPKDPKAPHPKAPKVAQPKGHVIQQLHQRPNHEQVNALHG